MYTIFDKAIKAVLKAERRFILMKKYLANGFVIFFSFFLNGNYWGFPEKKHIL